MSKKSESPSKSQATYHIQLLFYSSIFHESKFELSNFSIAVVVKGRTRLLYIVADVQMDELF